MLLELERDDAKKIYEIILEQKISVATHKN